MMQEKQQRLENIIKAMTLKEKVAQMLQLSPSFFDSKSEGVITGPMLDMGLEEDIDSNAGSVLGWVGAQRAIDIQTRYLSKNRHGIPLVFMADVIHGFRTIFPIPLAMSCSWDTELVEASAQAAAREASAAGVHVTFSPMADLVRDPRWGRVMEATGEDPYLNSLFARAFVRGYQNNDIGEPDNLAACVKHFAGYGASEAGRDYNTVDISERMLREYYLPAYKAAVEEGAALIMTSFNTINSIPATANVWLLREVLRKEWGFNGVVISDWGAVNEVINHGVAADGREAAEKSLRAGVDIEMMTSEYVTHLEKLVAGGKVEEALIDEAVMRILELKERLGLFENPYRGADPEKEEKILLCDEHRKLARTLATRSMVLLKNDGVLPLAPEIGKLAIIGPYADANHILGGWCGDGYDEEAVTLRQGMVARLGEDRVIIAQGCGITDGTDEDIRMAVEAAKKAEAIVLALGEHPGMSAEACSRAFITLPGRQQELAEAVLRLGKPTVTVLFNGRPLELRDLAEKTPALLEVWFPGTEGGNAIVDVLFGDYNPAGRLTMSFPYTVGQIPVYYNCFSTGRPEPRGNDAHFYSRYLDIPNTPLYPFGYGLSYTTFAYSDFALNRGEMRPGEEITASVTVTNTGSREGEEVVQLYIRDISGSVVRPVRELKAFQKLSLQPGETRKVSFAITEPMLRFHLWDQSVQSEAGRFIAYVGPNSAEGMEIDFMLIK